MFLKHFVYAHAYTTPDEQCRKGAAYVTCVTFSRLLCRDQVAEYAFIGSLIFVLFVSCSRAAMGQCSTALQRVTAVKGFRCVVAPRTLGDRVDIDRFVSDNVNARRVDCDRRGP